MNSESFRTLWQVPGVAKVTAKSDNLAQYQVLVREAINKVSLRQENNSYNLNDAKQRISDEETKISGFHDEIKSLEAMIANLKVQEASSLKKIELITVAWSE